jgi:hypothetical protein
VWGEENWTAEEVSLQPPSATVGLLVRGGDQKRYKALCSANSFGRFFVALQHFIEIESVVFY